MINGKKGIVFTLLALLIVAIFFVAFKPQSAVTLKEKVPVIESRVLVANDFVKFVKAAYLPSALRTSSYNALNAISQYQKASGSRFANHAELTSAFAEVMLNGSINCAGTHRDIEACICIADAAYPGCSDADPNTPDLMHNRNFTQRQRDVANLSINMLQLWSNFTYDRYNVVLFQNNETGPFQVGVNATVNFSVNAGVAWWNFTETITTVFSFSGIEDPLYSVESMSQLGTRYTNVFNETNLTSWNLTNTYKEIDWRKYRHNANGSSFLTRFTTADSDSKCCGIESFINPQIMTAPAVSAIEKPFVDWCFFGTRCPLNMPGALFNISCISNNGAADNRFRRFALDTAHITMYNLTNFIYTKEPDPLAAQCQNLMQAVCSIDLDIVCI
jgi:hypothetical protein